MPIDSNNSGLAAISRTMPKKMAMQTPSEICKNGSCSYGLSSSDLTAFRSAHPRRMAPMRLPVRAPSGAISRRAPIVTFGQAVAKADIRTAR